MKAGAIYTVVGRDSYGDGWEGGSLRIINAFGEVYFGPWSGPRYSRATVYLARFLLPFS